MKKLLSAVLIALIAGMPAVAQGQGSDAADNAARSNWQNVVAIKATTTIRLIAVGDAQVEREFVSANGAGMTVLNLSLPSLPGRAKHVLTDTAKKHPERFDPAHASLEVGDDFRMSPDGVFLSGRRVAATEDVVIRIPRDRVVEVSRKKMSAFEARVWTNGAGWLLGLVAGWGIGKAVGGSEGAAIGGAIGTGAGVVVGLWRGGWRGRSANIKAIIYRAPGAPA
jgi:hypothetical protein